MTRASIACAAAVLALGVAMATTEPAGYPLVLVPQGVSDVVEGHRAFLDRQGTLTLTAFARRSPARDGGTIVWCPRERLFYDEKSASLWDARGRYIFGPAPRDLDTYRVTLTERQFVRIGGDVIRARRRSKGEIAEETFEFYQRYLNRGTTPTGATGRLVWCPNPMG